MTLRSLALASLLALVALAVPASAQTLQWDPLLTPVTPSGGTGTWDITTANWSNGVSDVIWTGGNTAVFGGTAGTVTVPAATTIPGINGITFNTSGYTIAAGNATTSVLTLTAPTITVLSGSTQSIATPLAGTVGLTLTGGGTLNLTGVNTLTGAYTIDAANTLVGIGDIFSPTGNAVTVNGTLALTIGTAAGTGRYINDLQGSGILTNAGLGTTVVSYRVKQGNFSGSITNGPTAPTALLFEATGGLLNLSGTNTYTGDTLIRNGGTLRLSSAGALPTNSWLRMGNGSTGTLELTAASGDLIRPGATASFAGGMAFESGTVILSAIGGDRTVNIGGTLTWGNAPFAPTILGFGSAASDSKVNFSSSFSVGTADRVVQVNDSAPAIDAELSGVLTGTGKLTKTGTGTLLISNTISTGGFYVKAGVMTINTPAANTNTLNNFTSVGQNGTDIGTLNIIGATNYTNASDFNVSDVASSRGTLNINTTGTVRYNQMFVGKNTTTVGVMNLINGTVLSTGSNFRLTADNNAQGAYGYVNQTGGSLQTGGSEFTIGWGGIGVYNLSGGTILATGFSAIGRLQDADSAGRGMLNVSGTGNYTVNAQDRLIIGEQGRGWLNVSGGEVVADGVRLSTNNAGAITAQLNVTGGIVTTDRFWKDGTQSATSIYLNGGTIRARNNSDAAIFLQGIDRTTVGPAGATISTNGFDITINQVLSAPSGQGIATIPVLTGGAGYVGEPIVNIDGLTGGAGRAVIVGGVLTAITIINPGNDYAAVPTVTLLGGGATTAATLGTPTLITNAADGGIIKAGTGVLTLTANNTFTGPLTLSAGTLAVPTINDNGIAGPLGMQATAAGLVFNGGSLRYTGANASTTRGFSIAAGQQATFDVATAGVNLTLNGVAPTTSEGITKVGLGVLTLNFSSPANYTGITRANAGILAMTGSNSTTVQVNAGRLNATYQAVDTTLTVPALNLTSGSGIDFDFGAGNDTITVANVGGLSLTSTSLNLYQAGGTTAFTTNGTYTLFNYNTSFAGSLFGAFSVANSQPGKVYSITNSASTIDLTIGDAVTTTWNVDGGGSWGFAGNWTAGVPDSIGAVATFGSILTTPNSPATITLDGPRVVGNLIFDNANSYVITGGATDILTINNGIGAPLISAIQGNHSVAAPIVLLNPTNINSGTGAVLSLSGAISGAGSVTKLGAGTLVLGGANSFTGSTLVTAGTLEVANSGALAGTPNLTVRNLASLRVSSAATSFAGPVVLDLNGGAIVNIPGTENGTGNYAIDVTGGAAFTVGGLFNNTGGTLVKSGGGTLTLSNPGANVLATGTGIALAVQNGTLTLNGGPSATYAAGAELTVGDNTPNTTTLNLQSGSLTTTAFFSISRGNGTTGLTATVNVTGGSITTPIFTTGFANGVAGYNTNSAVNVSGNATITATNQVTLGESAGNSTVVSLGGTSTLFSQNYAEVGRFGVGLIKVDTGATLNVSNFFFGGQPGGSGAVWNRGTTIVRSGASTNHFAIGNALNSYGYYLSDSAVTTTVQEIGIGGAGGGSGVLELKSGSFVSQQWVTVNRTNAANATSATLLINGGTLTPNNLAGRFYVNQNVAANQYATLEVMGAGRIAGGNVADINLNNNSLGVPTTTLTLSGGGTIETTRIYAANAIGNVYVNFNGGTIKATANGNLLDNNLDAVTLHAGGVTVNSNGFNISLGGNAILDPVGSGITSIPVLTGGTRYIGRPVVQISDPTGTGAAAIANFDEVTGLLTGITITSPGSNYLSPTITLVGGGFATPATLDVPVLGAVLPGTFTKTGAGILTVTATGSSYSGGTFITGGTYLAANTVGSATGSGPVSVATGANLAGGTPIGSPTPTGFISGVVSVASGGSITPGNVTGVTSALGNLTVGGLTLASGSIINQQILDALSLDQITVTNFDGLTINGGGYNLFKSADGTAFSTNGVYNLIGYSGTIQGLGTSALSVLNPQPGKTYAFGENAGFVVLTIATAGGVPNFWNVDSDGNWTVGTNWTLGSAPNGVSAFANFGGGGTPISQPRTVTVNANQTVGAIAFNSAVAFTIAGTNSLTLNNGLDPNAQVTVTLGNHTISAPMIGVSANTQFNVLNPTDSLTVSGTFSGTTNVSKIGSGLLTLSGTNTYAGTTGLQGGTLELLGTAALGNSTALNVSSGTVLRLGSASSVSPPVNFLIGGGTPAGMTGLANGTANFTVDVPVGTGTIAGVVTNTSGSFVKIGPGTLALTNSGTNTLANVGGLAATVQDGVLTLNNGSFGVTGEFTIGDATPNTTVGLTVLGGSLNVSSYISVGRGTSTTGATQTLSIQGGSVTSNFLYTGYNANVGGYNAQPNIIIANAAIVTVNSGTRLAESPGAFSTMTISDTATLTTAGDTQVGYGGVGILNISGTAVVTTGGLSVGTGNNAGANTGAGALVQTGGTVQQAGGGGEWRFGGFNLNDANAYGSYTLSGGTLNSGGRNIQIGAYGAGVLDIRGGDFITTGGSFPVIGRYTGGNGLLNISSGSFSQNGTGNLLIIGEQGTGVMNVTGGTVTVLANPGGAGNAGGTGGIRLGHTATGVGTLNLLGGTVIASGIAKSNTAGIANVYFSGGTLRANAANATYLQGLDNVVIGTAGATIDTNGNNITIAQNLNAPVGQGVITFPVASGNGGSGYIGQPIVQITGDGTGATAVANVTGGVVTSITVTNPGSYGSFASVSLIGGSPTVPATIDPGVLGTITGGGLNKNGAGTLTLSGSNTYTGTTAVNAGTLLAANTSGSATGTGPVNVAGPGTLRGTGIVNGLVSVNGTLRAGGPSIAALTFENGLAINSGGRLYVDLGEGNTNAGPGTGGSTTSAASNNFLTILGGTTTISPGTLVTVDGTGVTFVGGQYSYKVASGAGDQSALNITNAGQFTFVNINAIPSTASLTGNVGGDVFVNFTVAVPEPVFLLGFAGLAGVLLRRRKA